MFSLGEMFWIRKYYIECQKSCNWRSCFLSLSDANGSRSTNLIPTRHNSRAKDRISKWTYCCQSSHILVLSAQANGTGFPDQDQLKDYIILVGCDEASHKWEPWETDFGITGQLELDSVGGLKGFHHFYQGMILGSAIVYWSSRHNWKHGSAFLVKMSLLFRAAVPWLPLFQFLFFEPQEGMALVNWLYIQGLMKMEHMTLAPSQVPSPFERSHSICSKDVGRCWFCGAC